MMPSRFFLFAAALGSLLLASCATTSQISLDYASGIGHILPGPPEFATQAFTDRRGVGAYDLGTVRTQIGTPVEHVQSRVPVADMVTNAFGYALQGRGMLAQRAGSRFIVTGEVLDLQCKLLVHPYGYARLRVTVLDSGSGRVLHRGVYEGERQSGAYVPGSGSPVPLLQSLTSGALQDAVDRALDDPDMRARISSGARPGPGAAPGEVSGWQPGML